MTESPPITPIAKRTMLKAIIIEESLFSEFLLVCTFDSGNFSPKEYT
jgi:hypothetical protein